VSHPDGDLRSQQSWQAVKQIIVFIPDISIVPLQVRYYSETLPTTALILRRS